MSSAIRQVLYLVFTAIIAYWLIQMAFGLVLWVVYGLLPMAIVTGLIYIAYITVGRKVISGGRRTLP